MAFFNHFQFICYFSNLYEVLPKSRTNINTNAYCKKQNSMPNASKERVFRILTLISLSVARLNTVAHPWASLGI